MLVTSNVIKNSGVQFGTSGARGLVVGFTPSVCAAFAVSFAKVMQQNFAFTTVAIAIDNRPSSYAMAQACAAGLQQLGIKSVYYGVVPTPALAYKAMQDNMPAIMVTGSHIPFDRNGLKFYRPDGEISKADELAILAEQAEFTALDDSLDLAELAVDDAAKTAYIERYTSLYPADALAGKSIGIYEHSSAGRDIYRQIFEALGAQVTSLERSNEFVAIDTEAVSAEDQAKAQAWSKEFAFDAIFSTDGDGDRPLIADENGNWLRGDILGLLCSKALNIQALAVPVSCNTAIEQSALFTKVVRTKIGSPYVIAEFSVLAADLADEFAAIAGFEANGGYLLGSDVLVEGKSLKALPTRDALLPAFALLTQKATLAEQLKTLPPRFTVSDRLKDFATDKSKALIAELTTQPEKVATALGFTAVNNVNTTDGLRITMNNADVVHFRPSGNAPELRCYVESASTQAAQQLLTKALEFLLGL
ncbi:phosphomannomutase [Catenovulum agarivorans DS-2]|uniref:Phosphomannomutase n=1 Tax=Catenovulum agarivorans DS-2 TaxID=1328313 RepID=W7Q6S5_9ALTE|nr:phosphomannomutase [Catenovulum agarivorans]EWH08489.1 phosphomannomutase [Catenovulum agarivorans DS-2]